MFLRSIAPKQRKVNIESKSRSFKEFSISPDSFLAFAFGDDNYITAAQAARFYRSTAAIATAVDMIADAIEQIDPVVQIDGKGFTDNHPVLDLLKRPNGFQHQQQFMGKFARDYLLKHDVLIGGIGNINNTPIEIWPISFQNTSVHQGIDDYPEYYYVTRGPVRGTFKRDSSQRDRGTRFYDGNLKEVYHVAGYSSRYWQTESDSPLQAAAMEAKQIIKGKYHNVKLLDNGGKLSLLVIFKDEDEVKEDEHERRKQSLNEQLRGPGKAGAIGVMSNADIAEVRELGINNKDMDFANLEQSASKAIYLRYKIPLALVTETASTFNNVSTGIELLYDNAVLPTVDNLFSGLSLFLMPRFGLDASREKITYNPETITALKNRLLNEVLLRKQIGVETTNELRSLLPGREPLANGQGDRLVNDNGETIGTDDNTEDNNDI